jgi:SAM-dependent methyltransferase
MKTNTVPRRLRNDCAEIIDLTDIQRKARDAIRVKLTCGEYDTIPVPCPLCRGNDSAVVAEKDFYGFPVRTGVCRSCGMAYSNPRLTESALQKLYANEYRDLDRVKPSSDDYFELEKTKAIDLMDFLVTHGLRERIKGKLIVEIGCGAGGGLQYFASAGFSVTGCDLSPTNVDYGCSKGLDINYGDLDSVITKLGDRASCIGLVIYEQVFEHLVDPRMELSKLRNWLPHEALLYIGVPGLKNIERHYGADFLRYLQIPHLCHYELRTLVALLRCEGYAVLAGDESAKALFGYSGETGPVSINTGQYEDVLRYLQALERKRVILAPMQALRTMPTLLGLKLRNVIDESAWLPASVKRGAFALLKYTYHRFFK